MLVSGLKLILADRPQQGFISRIPCMNHRDFQQLTNGQTTHAHQMGYESVWHKHTALTNPLPGNHKLAQLEL